MQDLKNKGWYGSVLLLIAAFLWGSTFVAQSYGADQVGPSTFLCSRSVLGCVVLLPIFGLGIGDSGRSDSVFLDY